MTVPKLEWYVARPVEAVSTSSGGGYTIEFIDGVRVVCEDKRFRAPDVLGKSLLSVKYEDTEIVLAFQRVDRNNKLVGDVVEAKLNSTKYHIIDPRFGTEPQRPFEPQEDASPPPDPSADRVVEGPETPAESVTEGDAA